MRQKELSVWLRAVVILVFLSCLFLGVKLIPDQLSDFIQRSPSYSGIFLPCLIFFWATLFPVFIALALAWRIFGEIGRDNSFCMENSSRLRVISRLALLDTVLYIVFAAVLGCLKLMNPVLLTMFTAVVFVGAAMTITSAALSHLTCKAADMKSENDLTI